MSKLASLTGPLILLLALALAGGCCAAAADGRVPLDEAKSGTLYLKDSDGAVHAATRVDTSIRVLITGNLVRGFVTQDFSNPTDRWVEGVYVFPLAANAAVDELEMRIGERIVRGEIREREAARAQFKQAADAGQQASLIEQQRPNLFTSAVANIAPHASIQVTIGYFDSLEFRDGAYRLHLPLAITPRYAPGGGAIAESAQAGAAAQIEALTQTVESRSQRARIDIELRAGFRLSRLESLHHAAKITERDAALFVSLADAEVPQDKDFELVWAPLTAPTTTASAFVQRFEGASYALVTLMPPDLGGHPDLNREVIFIIDTSGSMQGPSISQARDALIMALNSLTPGDRFNLIRFSDRASSVFDQPMPVNARTLQTSRQFVRDLTADGGTEMLGALELALSMPRTSGLLRQIVFITDGAVGNEPQILKLLHNGLDGTRLFAVGIGAAPNAYFMQEAAAAGHGSYTFIADGTQVRERMGALLMKLSQPALTDLKLSWPDGATADLAVPLPGDLYAGEPVSVVARLPQAPEGLLSLSGQSASGAFTSQFPIAPVELAAGVSKLWARERIRSLEREADASAGDDSARARILPLALQHHLVSHYTSLVAIDQTPVRGAGEALDKTSIPATPPAGSAWATTGFAPTASPAPLWLAAGSACYLLAFGLWLWRGRRAI